MEYYAFYAVFFSIFKDIFAFTILSFQWNVYIQGCYCHRILCFQMELTYSKRLCYAEWFTVSGVLRSREYGGSSPMLRNLPIFEDNFVECGARVF